MGGMPGLFARMKKMTRRELLRLQVFCEELAPEELEKLEKILFKNSFVKKLEPKESLMQSGEKVKYIYLVESGMIRAINYTPTGEEIFFFYFSEGMAVGLLNAIGSVDNFSEFIAVKKSRLQAIPVENLNQAMTELPRFTRSVLTYVSKKSLELVQLVVISRRKKTRDRICSYLYLNYEKTKKTIYHTPFSIELLAKTLNLTRSACSKELHVLEVEGLISIEKNKIYLENPEGLKTCLFG